MTGSEIEKKSDLRPSWGHAHFLGASETGEQLEVLVSRSQTEEQELLVSWAQALERVRHPAIPLVRQIASRDERVQVCLGLKAGQSLRALLSSPYKTAAR